MSAANTIYDFLRFLARPDIREQYRPRISWLNLSLLFLISFTFTIILFGTLMAILGITDIQHQFENVFAKENTWVILITVLLIVPVMEEFFFRYHLKYHRLNLLFIYLTLGFFIFQFAGLDWKSGYLVLSGVVLFILFAVLMYRLFGKYWERIFTGYYGYIFYYTAAVFSFLHIYNFDLSEDQWIIAPILTVPQFILGLLLGYVRLRNDIWSSIVLHSINNVIPLMAFLLMNP